MLLHIGIFKDNTLLSVLEIFSDGFDLKCGRVNHLGALIESMKKIQPVSEPTDDPGESDAAVEPAHALKVRYRLAKRAGWKGHGIPVAGVVLPCPPSSIEREAVKGKSLCVVSPVLILLAFHLIQAPAIYVKEFGQIHGVGGRLLCFLAFTLGQSLIADNAMKVFLSQRP